MALSVLLLLLSLLPSLLTSHHWCLNKLRKPEVLSETSEMFSENFLHLRRSVSDGRVKCFLVHPLGFIYKVG